MSSVFLARDSSRGDAEVAVKVLDTSHPDEIKQELFKRETGALKRLRHPNIVELKHSGFSESLDAFYLVLEYVPYSLDSYLKGNLGHHLDGLDPFRVMRALAEALSHAHSENVVHRDIKPSNVLLDVNGHPFLADFGISKLLDHLTVGETLSGFWSSGYASPEQRTSQVIGPRSDIYSLGAVFFHLLSRQEPTSEGPTPDMVDEGVGGSRPLRNLLKRMLSQRPEDRQAGATGLLSALEVTRPLESLQKHFLAMTRNAINNVVSAGYSPTENLLDVEQALREDLGGTELDEVHIHLDNRDPNDLIILGDSLRLICTPHENGDALVVKAVHTSYLPILDAERGHSMPYRAYWQPVGHDFRSAENSEALSRATEGITNLLSELNTYDNVGAIKQEKRSSRRDFINAWNLALSRGRSRLEEESPSLDYAGFTEDSDRLLFELSDVPPDSIDWLDGTPLAVRQRGQPPIPIGNLVEIRGKAVEVARELRRFGQDELRIPRSGQLTTNIVEALADNRRQQYAINAFLYDQMANPTLSGVIVDPSGATRGPLPELDFFQRWLSDDKKGAVRKAISSNEIFLIQGPPGTGKTAVIAEIVLQILRQDPDSRILLTSQSNIAVDHALAQISNAAGDSPPEMVRIGRSEKISHGGESWTLEERARSWRRQVLAGCTPVIDDLRSEERALRTTARISEEQCEAEVAVSATVEEWIAEAKDLADQLNESEEEYTSLGPTASATTVESTRQMVDRTRSQLTDHLQTLNQFLPQPVDIDNMEAEEALSEIIRITSAPVSDPSDTKDGVLEEIRRLQEMRKVVTQWTRVVGLTEDFRDLISQSARVVAATCSISGKLNRGNLGQEASFDWAIIDEAGRATVPEVLIPIVRSERAILVGDERQLPPMVHETMAEQDGEHNLETSLFQSLIEQIEGSGNELISTLQTQYRMHPAIGNLISEVFYEGKLENGLQGNSRRNAFSWAPTPVIWFSTSRLPRRAETRSIESFANAVEVEIIVQLLEKMEEQSRSRRRRPSIGVISGYSAQVHLLTTSIDPEDRTRWRNLEIDVATVDSFQGRECDAVIYSTVRSNSNRTIGFLKDHRRINVALSRARDFLVIVGDDFMMENANFGSEPNPFASVIGYMIPDKSDYAVNIRDKVRTVIPEKAGFDIARADKTW